MESEPEESAGSGPLPNHYWDVMFTVKLGWLGEDGVELDRLR